MIINKTAIEKENFKANEYYYDSAREGMFDLLYNIANAGLVNTLFIPGYVGWSPKEGSGIFDPINKLSNISVIYYKMDKNLNIDVEDLISKAIRFGDNKFAVLIVNYFGFIDPNIEEIYSKIREINGWVIEDNAHGFFTSLYSTHAYADATFFSLHKMFPFSKGGCLKILNNKLKEFKYNGRSLFESEYNPWIFDASKIAFARRGNYEKLDRLIRQEEDRTLFEPLKTNLEQGIIPQTYPIIIKYGDRDRIYELMNHAGYGVVSLYHTLIRPLKNLEHNDAYELSKRILNLPVHQDVDSNRYGDMVKLLIQCCIETKEVCKLKGESLTNHDFNSSN